MTARTVHMAYGCDGLEIAVPSNATIIEPTYVPGLPDHLHIRLFLDQGP